MAIIQPLVQRFREKTVRYDTIFDLIECHKDMIAKLETAVFFEETPVIGKQVSKILKIAKDFERNHREKSTREEFVRTCANLRTLTKTIHEKMNNERTSLLFQGMSEVLYYTDNSSPGFSEEIFLDFDNVIPKEDERQVYNTVSPILAESQDILSGRSNSATKFKTKLTAILCRDLTNYEGAAAEIKKCIQSPSDQEHKDHTWNTLLPLVVRLKRYFEFSSALTEAYIDIIRELTRHQG
ncbi:unnamed protein product, partial [Oikopleura dioica]